MHAFLQLMSLRPHSWWDFYLSERLFNVEHGIGDYKGDIKHSCQHPVTTSCISLSLQCQFWSQLLAKFNGATYGQSAARSSDTTRVKSRTIQCEVCSMAVCTTWRRPMMFFEDQPWEESSLFERDRHISENLLFKSLQFIDSVRLERWRMNANPTGAVTLALHDAADTTCARDEKTERWNS